jgi:cytochrome oxidase Cu insertion factor (SCO1/SenC/PrrC family)
MKIKAVTQHAVDRFMERTGNKKPLRAMQKVFRLAQSSIPIGPIGKSLYFSQGWIMLINKRGIVNTIYRPRSKWEHKAIAEAVKGTRTR